MIQNSGRKLHERLGVVIPAFNPGEIITDIILQIKQWVPAHNILVVDDGSTDHTHARVERTGVRLHRHSCNRGKGATLASGFRLMLPQAVDMILTMDADGQHDPTDIPRFIDAMTDQYDMIIGDRSNSPGEMPSLRRFSNRFSSQIVSWVSDQDIPDSQCGYRLMRTDVIQNLQLFSTSYEYETELLLKAIRGGCRIGSLPLAGLYFAESSQIRKLRDTFKFAGLICRSFFWRRGDFVQA